MLVSDGIVHRKEIFREERMRVCFLGFIGAQFLRFIHWTLRWEKHGLDIQGRHWSLGLPAILVIWHGDQLMAPWAYRIDSESLREARRTMSNSRLLPRQIKALTSQHADGRIIAQTLGRLGIGNIAGSSTRGGVRALVAMRRAIESERCHLAITPDGPKGPIYKAKPGVISIASATGAPILPVGFGYERSWRIKSWDRMVIPKPFSRARMIAGELMRIPSELSEEQREQYITALEDELNRLNKVASEGFA
ncbi:DUF374 domain-containing protein [bacterium]|nr:DUF374 domain-containing protein [bacterium]